MKVLKFSFFLLIIIFSLNIRAQNNLIGKEFIVGKSNIFNFKIKLYIKA